MSEVAGRMAVQVGAHCLEHEQGGAGILLGGVPGVPPAKVVVLGGGVAGTNAARMAVGLEASVTIIDKSLPRLKELDLQFGRGATTLFATTAAIEQAVLAADLVIGAVLVPGAAAPKLVTRDDGAAHAARFGAGRYRHRPGRLLRDQPADHPFRSDLYRGRCGALLRHQHARRGGPDLDLRADQRDAAVRAGAGREGWRQAMLDDPHLAEGLNIHDGRVTHLAVAQALGLRHTPVRDVLVPSVSV